MDVPIKLASGGDDEDTNIEEALFTDLRADSLDLPTSVRPSECGIKRKQMEKVSADFTCYFLRTITDTNQSITGYQNTRDVCLQTSQTTPKDPS
jgi:acyl-CoA thioesterase